MFCALQNLSADNRTDVWGGAAQRGPAIRTRRITEHPRVKRPVRPRPDGPSRTRAAEEADGDTRDPRRRGGAGEAMRQGPRAHDGVRQPGGRERQTAQDLTEFANMPTSHGEAIRKVIIKNVSKAVGGMHAVMVLHDATAPGPGGGTWETIARRIYAHLGHADLRRTTFVLNMAKAKPELLDATKHPESTPPA
eukprot:4182157-Pyramimonas_sp.AAC.1